jgi:5-methylcytosine-specific restriction endonuclease McrA
MILGVQMKCKKCFKEHNGKIGSGIFCSISCARSYSSLLKRNEINEKVSKKMKGRKSPNSIGFTNEQRKKGQETRKKNSILNKIYKLKNYTFDQLSKRLKREKIREEQNNKCLICNLSIWNNKSILLELDHIDGNKKNNNRQNLRMICPNCHSQTKTYKSRNMSEVIKKKWKNNLSLAWRNNKYNNVDFNRNIL